METMEFMQQQHLDELHSSCKMLEGQYHAAPDIFCSDTLSLKEMQLSVTREAISICLDGLVPSIHNDPNLVLKNTVVVDGSTPQEPSGRVELKYYLVKHNRDGVISLSAWYCAEEGFPISVWLVREKALDAWFDAQEQIAEDAQVEMVPVIASALPICPFHFNFENEKEHKEHPTTTPMESTSTDSAQKEPYVVHV